MPKSYSEQERTQIKLRLHQEAERCLMQYGIRKTTVDELVGRVHIPKGTFYLFYPSKELLFFEVLMEQHDAMQARLMEELAVLQNGVTAQQLTELLLHMFLQIDQMAAFRLLTSGELEVLQRKLPPELVQEHFSKDDFEVEQLLHFLPQAKNKDIAVFSAALRGLFLLSLHREEMGGASLYEPAMRVLIGGVVNQLMAE